MADEAEWPWASRLPSQTSFRLTNQQIALPYQNRNEKHTSLFHVLLEATMPLVVPGLMSSSGSNSNNQQEDWMNKLVGKKLTDSTSDTTVRIHTTNT